MKRCAICKETKPLDEFYNNRTRPDGKTCDCKECRKKHRLIHKPYQKWYKKNRSYVLKKAKEYAEKNKDKIIKKRKIWYQQNKEESLKKSKEWYQKNKPRIREKRRGYLKQYNKTNKERLQEYRKNRLPIKRKWEKKYLSERRKNDPQFKLRGVLRGRIIAALKRTNITKKTSVNNLIGCDVKFFKEYLETRFKPGMTWENHGKAWHIDHIVPCSKFDLTNIEQQKICFNYSNTQPLFIEENLEKSDREIESVQFALV